MSGFEGEIMYADNVDFTGTFPPTGRVTANGELLIGSTAAPNIRVGTLTAGTGVSITNGAGSITINSSGGGVTWTEVTGTSQAMAVSNGYIANNAGLVTLSLPATSAVGDVIQVVGKGAGLWSISQAAGQQIHVGSTSSTAGVGGSVAAIQRRDSIALVCTTANLEWTAFSTQGNLTVT